MHSGAAHIVWEDENFERHHIQWCLDNFEPHEYATNEENEAVRQSLLELLKLPDNLLAPEPQAYRDSDDGLPKDYPPTVEMGRV